MAFLGVFFPIWPVSSHTNVMTGHKGTSTPKFVPSHCVAFLALRCRNVARESRYTPKVSQKKHCRIRLGGVAPQRCTVSIVHLCRAPGGVAATVSRVALHCATKTIILLHLGFSEKKTPKKQGFFSSESSLRISKVIFRR